MYVKDIVQTWKRDTTDRQGMAPYDDRKSDP